MKWVDKFKLFLNFVDVVIYEMYICDFFIYENSGMKNKGKYLVLMEIEM